MADDRHYPNKDDWDEQFWPNSYIITVTLQGIEFAVNASDEQSAIDEVIDYCAENMPGLLWSRKEEQDLEFLDEYISGGNEGRHLNTHYVRIVKL